MLTVYSPHAAAGPQIQDLLGRVPYRGHAELAVLELLDHVVQHLLAALLPLVVWEGVAAFHEGLVAAGGC